MPPYNRETDMCAQSDQQQSDITLDAPTIGGDNSPRRRREVAAMGNNSNNNDSNNLNRRSSITRRHSSITGSTNNRRHVTNINRINVINNYSTPSKGRTTKESFAWFILRIVLVSLILVWLVAMVSVLKNSPSAPNAEQTAQSKAASSLSLWKQKFNGMRGTSDLKNINISSAKKPKEEVKGTPIWELSLFGNEKPDDFQLSTPHAPSCSIPLEAKDVSYTLVSQLSHDRIWMVQYHCERWGDNPMSIAVFTDLIAAKVKADLVRKGCSEEHLTVQTVSKSKYDPSGTEYPVNLLRNLAISAVKTSHIVYDDVDFWPASDLHSILSDDKMKERLASDPKLATVLPVFQMNRRCKEYKDCRSMNIPSMPKNKVELINLIKKKWASTFDPTNVGGHGSTKYITWRDQEPRTFVDLPCIKSNRYEPYLAIRFCSDLPPFQEGFTGYGKNKMTWIMQLRRAGYLFTQLGGAFLVHYPHLDSKSRLEWNKKPKAMEKYHKSVSELLNNEDQNIDWGSFKRARVDALFLDFKEWLDGTVEDESRVEMCGDALNDDVRLWVHPDNEDTDGEGTDDDKIEEDTDEIENEEEEEEGSGDAEEELADGDTEEVELEVQV